MIMYVGFRKALINLICLVSADRFWKQHTCSYLFWCFDCPFFSFKVSEDLARVFLSLLEAGYSAVRVWNFSACFIRFQKLHSMYMCICSSGSDIVKHGLLPEHHICELSM